MYGLKLPLISPGDDLAKIIVNASQNSGIGLEDGDVIVLTSKIVSKSQGLLIKLNEVKPSRRALILANKVGEDPRFIEILLRESDELLLAVPFKELIDKGLIRLKDISSNIENAVKVIETFPVFFIVVRDGSLWTDAGIDSSNHPPGMVSIPPKNLDLIAKSIRDRIKRLTGKDVAIVICDTEIFLGGSLDLARGSYGIRPIDRSFGALDLYGKPKFGGVDLIVHELCAASALIMKQTSEGYPAVIIRGLNYEKCECGMRDILKMDVNTMRDIIKKIIKYTIKVLGFRWLFRIIKLIV